MKPNIKYEFGQIVYLKTDENQKQRIITGVQLRPSNSIIYIISLEGAEVYCYEFEFTTDKDVVKSLS